VAPSPNLRGHSVDLVLIDEVREQTDFDLMAAIRPTLTASRNPQIVYLSNAGSDESVVLNDLKRRGEGHEGSIGYLEWSSAPGRAMDDREGWREANPGLGIVIDEDFLANALVAETAAGFETEHLCRWVVTMKPKVVDTEKWDRLEAVLEDPLRPAMAISLDAGQSRASAVIAWRQTDGRIAVRLQADVTGEPVDVDELGAQLRDLAIRAGVREVAYDSLTDDALAKYFKKAKPMTGRAFGNACSTFVAAVNARQIAWSDADAVGVDLGWAARKATAEGAWVAVKANEDRPITAVLAAIRAVQLASGPRPSAPVVM
jgi:phage terminase large subunit-like protein